MPGSGQTNTMRRKPTRSKQIVRKPNYGKSAMRSDARRHGFKRAGRCSRSSLIADADACRSFLLEFAPGSRAGRSGDWVEKQRFTSFDQDILAIEEILDETKGGQGDRCLTAVGLICAKTVFAITVSDNDSSATWAKAALMSRRTDRIPSSPASSAFARYFIHSARRRNFFLAS